MTATEQPEPPPRLGPIELPPNTTRNPQINAAAYGFDTYENWLAGRNRHRSIGASEAAAALGESEWCSPLKLYALKRGEAQPDPVNVNMLAGRESEGSAIRIFNLVHATEHGGDGVRADPPDAHLGVSGVYTLVESYKHPWMAASPDAITVEADGSLGLAEIKCPGANRIHDWRREPPLDYLIQLYHQYIVLTDLGLKITKLRLVAWFGGVDLIEYTFDTPDQDMIDWIIRDEARLWRMIEKGTPPPSDGSRSSIDTIRQMAGAPSPGTEIELPVAMVARYFTARAAREEAEKEEKALAGDIMQAMGTNEVGMCNGVKAFTWKEVEYNYKAKEAYTDTRRVFSAARNWKKVAEQIGGN